MKNLLSTFSVSLIISAIILLDSCKKEANLGIEDDSVSVQDAAFIAFAIDQSDGDASAAAGQVTSFTGKSQSLYTALCGTSSVDSSSSTQLVITYDGTSYCNFIKRSGTVTVQLSGSAPWQNLGAALSVTYNNLKVTDEATGYTYTINGGQTITNLSGGLAWQIADSVIYNTITYQYQSSGNGINITFPNNYTAAWTLSRSATWTGVAQNNSDVITLSQLAGTASGMDISGNNRFGNSFTDSVINPINSNNYTCSLLYLPYQGIIHHQVGGRITTLNYGANSSGVTEGSATSCGASDLGIFITYISSSTGLSTTKFVLY